MYCRDCSSSGEPLGARPERHEFGDMIERALTGEFLTKSLRRRGRRVGATTSAGQRDRSQQDQSEGEKRTARHRAKVCLACRRHARTWKSPNLPHGLRDHRHAAPASAALERHRPPPFAALNADPRVMEFYPDVLTREESDALADRIQQGFAKHGFGLWALEIPGRTAFAGFVGLSVPRFEAAFTPCVEVGWRLGAEHWGQGYATEAARAVLVHGFGTLGYRKSSRSRPPRTCVRRR